MSLILDALNRSRTESEPVPGLASGPVFLPENESKLVARLPWVALVAALLLIVWLVSDRVFDSSGESVDTVKPADGAQARLVSQPPEKSEVVNAAPDGSTGVASASVQERAVAEKKPAKKTKEIKPAAEKPAVAKPAPAKREAAERAAKPRKVGKTAAQDIEQLYAAPRVAASVGATAPKEVKPKAKPKTQAKTRAKSKPKPVTSEKEVDVAKMVQMAERERRNAELEEHDAPMVSALSQPKKDSIPTLIYERHDYDSAAPGRSSVVINGKKLRKGGNAGRGVKVDEILKDSVVLQHQGTQFRLRALNSWVNL